MISVVVPAYNEEQNIRACLESLERQTVSRDQYEVIVVDGGSKDRTREIAA
ncbi:MAG TPA: glycosyltransferase, partial [Methanoregulaceae archaeon]|nr:glycosyltransferase [Methanoregulaceae archaeon]